jgi:hypothetical protein
MNLSDIQDDVYYEIKSLGRRILGKYLKSPYRRKAISEEIQRRKEEFENERRFFLNIGSTPVQKYLTSNTYIINSNFHGLRSLLQELGMPENPPDIYYSTLFVSNALFRHDKRSFEKFRKYTVEVFGLLIKSPEMTNDDIKYHILSGKQLYKYQPRYFRFSGGIAVQGWRLRVFNCPIESMRTSLSNPFSTSSPGVVYFEERWHPEVGTTLELRGLEHLTGLPISTTAQFIEDALRIYGKEKRRGRPRGPSEFIDRESFIESLTDAYHKLSGSSNRRPTQEAVAGELLVSLSTLKLYLRAFEVKWPPR